MSLDPITDPAVRPAFHLAIPVDDLARAAEFYGGVPANRVRPLTGSAR
jgi:hypothetical protein